MKAPVLTVTLNPAIDQTVELAVLRHGEVNVATQVWCQAGGKGVNVASCLADWGIPVTACGILGRENVLHFERLFAAKRIDDRCIRQDGLNRVNIKLFCRAKGVTTEVNLPGLNVETSILGQFGRFIGRFCSDGHFIVLAGCLPAGVADDYYAQLLEQLSHKKVKVILDTSHAALNLALSGEVLPFCVKPNCAELEEWAGRKLLDLNAIIDCAYTLYQRGIRQVLVTLGQEGAVFIGEGGSWLASPPARLYQNAVGAGDAFVAGWVAAQYQKLDWQESMRLSMAFAAGKLTQIGPHLPLRQEVQRLTQAVSLTRLD